MKTNLKTGANNMKTAKDIKTTRLEFGFIRLDLLDGTRQIPVLGLWLENGRDGRYYTNDRNGRTFKTIKAAKEYCIENYNQFLS